MSNRPKDFSVTAAVAASDDFAILDGATNGTRKLAAARLTRTLTGTAGQIEVANGDGVAGNPTLSLPTAITGVNSLTSAAGSNLSLRTGTSGLGMDLTSATGAAAFGGPVSVARLKVDSVESANASLVLACWGDSLTSGTGGTPFTAPLQDLLLLPVSNGGVAGETSTKIRTRMVAATDKRGNFTVIWAGRNNYADPTTVKADIAAMVAALTTTRYIVLGVTNASGEPSGNAGYVTIVALNADLAGIYGQKFIDIRSHLVSLWDPNVAQDVTDAGNDVPPSSLRSDSVHLNTAGYIAVAKRIYVAVNASEFPAIIGSDFTIKKSAPTITLANTGAGLGSFALATTAAAGQFRITEVGVADRLVIGKTTGNIGIGTSVPLNRLVVSDTNYRGIEFAVGATETIFGFDRTGSVYLPITLDGLTVTLGGASHPTTVAGNLTVAGTVIHTLSATPASAGAAGVTGTLSWDASYIYICTATNTWKRVAIATW